MLNFRSLTSDNETARKAFVSILILVISIRVLLVVNLPLQFLEEAGHDDGLFIRLAMKLASGHWLGRFDQYTLMKGPGYPAFLAVGALSGLPVSLTHALFQGAALVATAWAAQRITRSYSVAAVVFLLLALHPIAFVHDMQRILREQIYWGQSLLVVSLFAVLVLAPPGRKDRALALACAAGLTLGWAWLTREEGFAFLPGLAVLAAGAVIREWRNRSSLSRLLGHGLVAAAAFLALQLTFHLANLVAYGAFVGVDVKERYYLQSLNLLQSIEAGPVSPYVPVPLAARMEAARVSPAFAALAATLAPGGAAHNQWSKQGCRVYKTACGEIAGGWFLWAFRDAAAENGYYRSAKVARKSFKRLAQELAAACRDKRLQCRQSWLNYMPAVSSEQLSSLPRIMASLARKIVLLEKPSASGVEPVTREKAASPRFLAYWSFMNAPRVDGEMFRYSQLSGVARAVRRGLVNVYGFMAPLLAVAGLLALAIVAVHDIRSRVPSPILVVCVALWALVGARILLLALIDVSAFAANNYVYSSPAAFFVVMASVISLAGWLAIWRSRSTAAP